MKLRVPDYYSEFACIADKCKDSCCIGWEIDIDEDTHEFYSKLDGRFGDKLREYMYEQEDGVHSFTLKEHGRCPFLNSKNLCDICIELGEEALSEVCTEYPRFAIEYEDVLQKCLSLSCEEVGRIVFSRDEPVRIIDMQMQDYDMSIDDDEENNSQGGSIEEEDFEIDDEYAVSPEFLSEVQDIAFELLQDRSKSIWDRMREYLLFAEEIQNAINADGDVESPEHYRTLVTKNKIKLSDYSSKNNFAGFSARFSIFEEMETLDIEWDTAKKELREILKEDTYDQILQEFLQSKDMLEKDYEHLMVYFTFRYMMNAVYDSNLLSYAKLAVVFTLMIRDMDAVRFYLNDGKYSLKDRIDVARIFSKEVEHSEENVEYAREEFLFEDDKKI